MGHTYACNLFHVIFSTKDRRAMIPDELRHRLYEYLSGIARGEFGRAIKVGGTQNHVHGLLSVRTDVSIAEAMRKWKSLSSRWVHATFPAGQAFAWQSGYGSFTVSQSNAAAVIAYIDNQIEHHRVTTFEEEFLAFLHRHQVAYDPAHVWD